MRAIAGYVCACSALLACGSSSASNSNNANVIFSVEQPTDTSCVGVAGFEVTISSGTRTVSSGPLLNMATVLQSDKCQLPHSFSLANLDLDSPASVTVAGHDGAGTVRVQSMGQIDNLRAMAAPLQLMATANPVMPVLVIPRKSLLGISDLSQVTKLTVTSMKRAMKIVDVGPGDYFSVEPGAYGVSSSDLSQAVGDGVFIDVTLNNGGAAMRTKATATWNGTYYEAQ